MEVDVTEISTAPRRAPLYSVRWGAIFAGLSVGVAVHLLLMLIGIAAGFAMFDIGERPSGAAIPVAAAAWNTISMLISALIGGYVAARTSALRRTSDGVLHGVVAWGATMLIFAALATSALGGVLGGMFGLVAPSWQQSATSGGASGAADVVRSIQRGDRDAAVNTLQSRLGLSADDANRMVDQAIALTGKTPDRPEAAADVERTARAATVASTWLCAAILLSLLAAVGGGTLGARGTRRLRRIDMRTEAPAPPPRHATKAT